LREAVSTLGLAGAQVVTGRIEDVGSTVAGATTDLVTVRAVRMDPEVLGAARKILKLHGRLLVFRGQDGVGDPLDGFETVGPTSLHPSTGILAAYRRVS
jgi:16S rRNA G527 N7-methylase RsmG